MSTLPLQVSSRGGGGGGGGAGAGAAVAAATPLSTEGASEARLHDASVAARRSARDKTGSGEAGSAWGHRRYSIAKGASVARGAESTATDGAGPIIAARAMVRRSFSP